MPTRWATPRNCTAVGNTGSTMKKNWALLPAVAAVARPLLTVRVRRKKKKKRRNTATTTRSTWTSTSGISPTRAVFSATWSTASKEVSYYCLFTIPIRWPIAAWLDYFNCIRLCFLWSGNSPLESFSIFFRFSTRLTSWRSPNSDYHTSVLFAIDIGTFHMPIGQWLIKVIDVIAAWRSNAYLKPVKSN